MYRNTLIFAAAVIVIGGSVTRADIFGDGANQFSIDFVTISGDAGDLGSWPAGNGYAFTGVNRDDYRIGTFEITNDQWDKFTSSLGVPVTGAEFWVYDEDPLWTGENVPTNNLTWHEAAQFVNWLNTSTGHSAAYKFTGTQGTGDYALGVWEPGDAGYDADNPYRNGNAHYFLPTEDEWVKAAYWNGSSLQTWATPDDEQPIEDVESNYGHESGTQPWDVGSGCEELNGTYDMMGNTWEWMESPFSSDDYEADSVRALRGGSFDISLGGLDYDLASTHRYEYDFPYIGLNCVGFRVASNVPEPSTLVLVSLGGLLVARGRRR